MKESLKMTLRKQTLKSGQTEPLLPLQNLLVSSTHPHNSLPSCCYSLLVPVNALRYLDASFSQSKPLSHRPLLRLRLRFLSFFKGVLLPNFKMTL
jgi:hypothetical protein